MTTLADLVRSVGRDLARRKYPYPVKYSPERSRRADFAAQILFSRDREAGDTIAPPQGSTPQAEENKRPFSRVLAGAFEVYARSPKPGARAEDHEAEVDAVVDGVVTAMYRICKAAKIPLAFTSCRMLGADEVSANADRPNEQYSGSAARVTFTLTGPVRDLTYQGAGPLTGEVFDVANEVEAELAPGESESP